MTAKRRSITHVPDDAEVTLAPSSSSRLNAVTQGDATDVVTLVTLAGDIAEIKLEIGVIVEWLHALENALTNEG